MTSSKGNVYQGFISGANYDRFMALSRNTRFHKQAAWEMRLQPGMRVLDLGCGTGLFGLAIAEYIGETGALDGIDLAAAQIEHGRNRAAQLQTPFTFHQSSIDELPFDDQTFDAAASAFTFHHVPPDVRRGAIREIARVLKPGGIFALVDISRPRLSPVGFMGVIWFAGRWLNPLAEDQVTEDHWYNAFPALCQEQALDPAKDVYLNDIVRCQIFRKRADV